MNFCKLFGHKWVWGLVKPHYCHRCGYVPNEQEQHDIVSREYGG
jgi:prophage protein DUF1660